MIEVLPVKTVSRRWVLFSESEWCYVGIELVQLRLPRDEGSCRLLNPAGLVE